MTKPWDLSVPGVTSISADLHKYGYASPRASRSSSTATAGWPRLQPFVTTNWLGGLYGSPSMAGTRPAGPIAAGWAVLHYLGADGYLGWPRTPTGPPTTLRAAIDRDPGLALRGAPDATVFAFGATTGRAVDTFALGDALADRGGWFFDRQTPPDSLHATVQAGHRRSSTSCAPTWPRRPPSCAATGARAADRGTTYGTT